MASRPFFDKSTGFWCCKWFTGQRWKKERLCKHPTAWTEARPPKKPSLEAERLAAEFAEREQRARLGFAVDTGRGHPLGTYIKGYLTRREPTFAEGSRRIIRRVFGTFEAWATAQGVKTIEAVTAEVCRGYVAHRLESVKPKTAATEKQILSPLWTEAADADHVPSNPWRKVKVASRTRRERPHYWTKTELARVVDAARADNGRPWLADFVLVAVNTGLRVSALCALEWTDVIWTRGVVRVRAELSKSGREYEIPMSVTANEILARRHVARDAHAALVFPSPAGRPMNQTTSYRAISEAARSAGVPDHGAYNHILRHSFISNALLDGVPLSVVSRWAGHSSITMTERYAHLSADESARQIVRFDVSGSEKTPAE